MCRFEIIDNREIWRIKLNNFESIDCYYSYEYGDLFAENENGKLFAAYFEEEDNKIFYPFIKREVPFMDDNIFYDIVTPYGYGGPLIMGNPEAIIKFYKVFGEYCQLNNIITETIRFHPIYQNNEFLGNILDIDYIRQTTAVDLTIPIEEIRKNYTKMNKRNIKKAKNNNLTCLIADKSKENIELFIDLYKETMDRTNASSYYYFDDNYFYKQIEDTAINNTYLLFIKKEEEVIAGVMVFIGHEFSHYHLGASKTNYLELKPNNLLFDYMIEFCQSKGSKLLHLGGGYQEDDGLFKFKASFTNNNHYKYFIGKKIHNPNVYNTIIKNLRYQFVINERYFPIYRGQLVEKFIHN